LAGYSDPRAWNAVAQRRRAVERHVRGCTPDSSTGVGGAAAYEFPRALNQARMSGGAHSWNGPRQLRAAAELHREPTVTSPPGQPIRITFGTTLRTIAGDQHDLQQFDRRVSMLLGQLPNVVLRFG